MITFPREVSTCFLGARLSNLSDVAEGGASALPKQSQPGCSLAFIDRVLLLYLLTYDRNPTRMVLL